MSGRGLSVSVFLASWVMTGCGNGDDSSGSSLTCGTGTVQQGNVCLGLGSDGGLGSANPDGGAGGGGSLICGAGTVQSGSTCVVGPAATIAKARLTYLNVKYDTTKPVLLNNPVPIEL